MIVADNACERMGRCNLSQSLKEPFRMATHPKHRFGCREVDAEDLEDGWEAGCVGWVEGGGVGEEGWW